MEALRTQSDRLEVEDLVILTSQVINPRPEHKVGRVYRVKGIDTRDHGSNHSKYLITITTLDGSKELGARAHRLKKI